MTFFKQFTILQNIVCYPTKRESPFSSLKHLKPSSASVIPARFQAVSNTNYDSLNTEYFPTVEHPSSVVDDSNLFYLSSSPFSAEVTSLFKSLTDKKVKTRPTIDYTKKAKAVQKEKVKKPPIKAKTDFIRAKITKGLSHKDPVTNNEQTSSIEEELKNLLTGKCTECDDITYVLELINDIDELIKTINHLEEECKKDKNENTIANANDTDCINDTPMSSVVTSSEPNTELNGNSEPIENNEQEPFEGTDDNVNSSVMVNDGNTTDSSSEDTVDGLQADRSEEAILDEDNNSSCTE